MSSVTYSRGIWKTIYEKIPFLRTRGFPIPPSGYYNPEYELKFTLKGLTRLSEIYLTWPQRLIIKKPTTTTTGVEWWNVKQNISRLPQGSCPAANIIERLEVRINDVLITQNEFNLHKVLGDVYRKQMIREPEDERAHSLNGLERSNQYACFLDKSMTQSAKGENAKQLDNWWKDLQWIASDPQNTSNNASDWPFQVNIALKELDPAFDTDICLPANTKIAIRILLAEKPIMFRWGSGIAGGYTDAAVRAYTTESTATSNDNNLAVAFMYTHILPDETTPSKQGIDLYWPVKEYKFNEVWMGQGQYPTFNPWPNATPALSITNEAREFILDFRNEIPEKLYIIACTNENYKTHLIKGASPYMKDSIQTTWFSEIAQNQLIPFFPIMIEMFHENDEKAFWTIKQQDNQVQDEWHEAAWQLYNQTQLKKNRTSVNGYQHGNYIELDLKRGLDLIATKKTLGFVKLKVTLSSKNYFIDLTTKALIKPPCLIRDEATATDVGVSLQVITEKAMMYYVKSNYLVKKALTLIDV